MPWRLARSFFEKRASRAATDFPVLSRKVKELISIINEGPLRNYQIWEYLPRLLPRLTSISTFTLVSFKSTPKNQSYLLKKISEQKGHEINMMEDIQLKVVLSAGLPCHCQSGVSRPQTVISDCHYHHIIYV